MFWAMTLGGYPVIKKWLSYREYEVLGRAIRIEEMFYVTEAVRRLKALLLMSDELNANYRAAADAPPISPAPARSANGPYESADERSPE